MLRGRAILQGTRLRIYCFQTDLYLNACWIIENIEIIEYLGVDIEHCEQIIELLNYWIIELLNYWVVATHVELLNYWTIELWISILNYWIIELLNYGLQYWIIEILNYWILCPLLGACVVSWGCYFCIGCLSCSWVQLESFLKMAFGHFL